MSPTTNVAQSRQLERPDAEPSNLTSCFREGPALELVMEMAHDLRSPLTSIMFLAEAVQLGQSGPINEVQRRQLGLIRTAALCLCGVASDVLELARGGDGLVDHEPLPFSIGDVFHSVRDLVRPLAEEKGLDLRFLAPELEERIGHERAVARVLLNLTTNALKFTERGFVEVAARETGPTRIEFSVRDTGPGIGSDSLAALCQPFPSRPTGGGGERGPQRQFSSSGLGLAICRKLVAAMGSQVEVKTRPGYGTKFTFALELPPVLACVAR
jgi:signal transduction histidine kinase